MKAVAVTALMAAMASTASAGGRDGNYKGSPSTTANAIAGAIANAGAVAANNVNVDGSYGLAALAPATDCQFGITGGVPAGGIGFVMSQPGCVKDNRRAKAAIAAFQAGVYSQAKAEAVLDMALHIKTE